MSQQSVLRVCKRVAIASLSIIKLLLRLASRSFSILFALLDPVDALPSAAWNESPRKAEMTASRSQDCAATGVESESMQRAAVFYCGVSAGTSRETRSSAYPDCAAIKLNPGGSRIVEWKTSHVERDSPRLNDKEVRSGSSVVTGKVRFCKKIRTCFRLLDCLEVHAVRERRVAAVAKAAR